MHICDVIKNKQLQRITRHSLLSQWKVLIKMTLSFQPQLLSKYESSSNTCLEFILITCRVRRWLNLLGEITQRCYKIIQMSHQTRQWQLHTTLTECSVTACSLCLCQTHELMDETKAGEEVAVQRRRPQVWTGVWVHCRSGMGAVPGAQLRGVARRYTQPLGLCWNTESLGRRRRRAGKEGEVGWVGFQRKFNLTLL